LRPINERLFDAAAKGDMSAVRTLIRDGADPNVENDPVGNTYCDPQRSASDDSHVA
jgi:hypothetical protein